MKISLINTPRSPHNGILDHAPAESLPYIHRKLIGPPLGLLTVAATVPDHDVTVLETKAEYDLDPGGPPLRALVRAHLEEHRPDVVGTTVIASELGYGLDILDEAKRWNPRVLTVAGGLHATLCPGDLASGAADVVAVGPATKSFPALVRAVERGESFDGIAGLCLNGPDGWRYTGDPQEPVDAAGADFVMPDRRLIDRWKDTYMVGGSPHRSTYMFTSLGCPYRCSFCSIWPQHGGRFWQRSVDSVVEELGLLDDYPVVRFSDANTLVGETFIDALFDRILSEGIEKTFIMDIRVDAAIAHPRLIEKMARGGLKVVISGFESFRNEELRRYNKSSDARLIHEAIDIFHDNGIMLRGNYVVPPDYDRDDFEALADYAGSHKVTYAGYTILTPMPGTPLHRELEPQIADPDLAKYNFFNSVLHTTLPRDEFHRRVGALWTIKKGRDVI
jgi:hopanoid C-3 methylase